MASLVTSICVFFSLVVPQKAISASPRLRAASAHNVGEPLLNWSGFVINMETAPERLQSFWADAAPQPWFRESFCRFRAVNGHDPAVLEDLMAKRHFPGFNDSAIQDAIHEPGSDLVEHFSTGAVALYESHLQIMRIIAADPTIDFGVIAEDDLALYSDDFKVQFNKLMDNQQGAAAKFWQDTDLVYLQACNQGWNRSSYRDPMGERVLPREDMATNFEDVSKEIVYCTALYAVSKEGAKKLSAEDGPLLPIIKPLDWVLPYRVPGIRAKAFHPSIAQAWGADDEKGSTSIQKPVSLRSKLSSSPIPDCDTMHWSTEPI